ncbi:EamA family transporter RarD [Roseovarius spongiae]|uniref:EamA family transporter RarD n=1 Tax=Roseovarius spongiae TaxID=2320272 RepID=A0A3A8AYT2_9RHOB|nr:EamA family transporter RarD [Roseovarius spongiae]RKF16659.1 EamA family transporter RarD [Roseovarius spongiae]
MTETSRGILSMVAACTIWGLSPLYYKLLTHIPPIEVLAHRTLWSFALFAVVLALQGRLGALAQAVRSRRSLGIIALAALVISVNWFTFISSIQMNKAIEASLGYFIFPLVSVALGALVYRETLGRAQIFAVALATLAVVTLAWGLGVAPWLSLILAVSFGFYGVIKKGFDMGPVISVTAEVLLLIPLAVAVLVIAAPTGPGPFGRGWSDMGLLLLSGPLTAAPLILFSAAARRVSLATVGLVQYLNPTLQFGVATLIFAEPFTRWHMIAFPMIWLGLAVYTAAAWRQDRAARKALKRASTSVTRW